MASNLCKRKGRAKISFLRSQEDGLGAGRLIFTKANFPPDEMSLDQFEVLDRVHGSFVPYNFCNLRLYELYMMETSEAQQLRRSNCFQQERNRVVVEVVLR